MKILFTQLPINNNFLNIYKKQTRSAVNFSARIPKDVFEKKTNNQFNYEQFGFTSDDTKAVCEFFDVMKSYPDIRKSTMEDLKLLNEKYKDNPKFLNLIYSQNDEKTGDTIFHDANFIVLNEVNRVLASYPDLLSKFYLNKNKQGELPIHKVNDYPKNERLKGILKVFEDKPSDIIKMLTIKNNEGLTPYDVIDYKGRRIIHNVLKSSDSEFLADLYYHHAVNCRNPKEETQAIQGAWDLATNSDLSIEKSLELCNNFVQFTSKDYDFKTAIEYLNSLIK